MVYNFEVIENQKLFSLTLSETPCLTDIVVLEGVYYMVADFNKVKNKYDLVIVRKLNK